MLIQSVPVNGVNVYPFASVNAMLDFLETKHGMLIAINADKIRLATDETRQIINQNIGYPDGVGAIIALEKKGCRNISRIRGCEVWLRIIERYYKTKTFYFIGAAQEVIDTTISKLKEDFKEINILGYRNGYINTEEERKTLIDDVAAKRPDIVFVAMGSPKQELLMGDMQRAHPAIYQGLGGSFDLYIGLKKDAPAWMMKLNLEALYRLMQRKWWDREVLKRYWGCLCFVLKAKLGLVK